VRETPSVRRHPKIKKVFSLVPDNGALGVPKFLKESEDQPRIFALFDIREPGENPGRSRHCERFIREVRILSEPPSLHASPEGSNACSLCPLHYVACLPGF
jgi:hypothetical protein